MNHKKSMKIFPYFTKNSMIHTDERTNWNWVCKDPPKVGLPFLRRNGPDQNKAMAGPDHRRAMAGPDKGDYQDKALPGLPAHRTGQEELWLPTVGCVKEVPRKISSEKMINCDDCFIASTEQYKNLYIQAAACYAEQLNKEHGCERLLDENSLARRILVIATQKITDIEKHGDNRPVCKEMVRAIGELASQFIVIALRYRRTDGLLELFNEALNRILRSNDPVTPITRNISRRTPSRCILEQCELVSDDSAASSNRSQSDNSSKVRHLTDWYGEDTEVYPDREKGSPANSGKSVWVWSEQKRNYKVQQ